jgi:deazaflavin-dependent oxidoreductase (nitroreductase family)
MSDDTRLAQGFKVFNRFMLLMWRLGLGRWINFWPDKVGRIMVIGHTGRRSGLRRWTPVNYDLVDGDVICLAGFGATSDWYRNVMVDPQVEVWLPDGWWAGIAEDISDSEDRLPLLRHVLIASGFAAPLFGGFDPRKVGDEQLEHVTEGYRLLRIHRVEARTGPGGPGDLAWVWPLLAFVLLMMRPFRRRRRSAR